MEFPVGIAHSYKKIFKASRLLLASTLFLILASQGCQTTSLPKSEEDSQIRGLIYRYIPEEDFYRISEFFSGDEWTGSRIYLRTVEDSRDGYYWIIPLNNVASKEEIHTVDLSVQIPGSEEVFARNFSIEKIEKGKRTLWVGVTGEDWPGARSRPIAWDLHLQDAQGNILERHRSFLWNQ